MALGQDLAPHLPFLRRYARYLTGNPTTGDRLVRATLDAIISDPGAFPRDVDPRVGLYRTFQVIWSNAEPTTPTEGVRNQFIARIPSPAREVLLLIHMEGFAPEDAGYILKISPDQAKVLLAEAFAEMDRLPPAKVLIIEDEPIVAMDIETIVRDLKLKVVGVASTRDEAVASAKAFHPDLILADIQLADDSSGIDAIKDILEEYPAKVIFITAFPERLLTGERPEPTFLITKPFQRSTVRAAIQQALIFDAEIPVEEPVKAQATPAELALVKPIPNDLVRSRPSPIDVKVIRNQLRYVDTAKAEAASSDRIVNAVRKIHLATARRLAVALVGSNVGPGFNSRFEAIYLLLRRALSSERALQLAIHVRGLEGMMDVVAERLDEVTVADIAVFVADLIDLLNQLPVYRRFSEEARTVVSPTNEGASVASAVAAVLEQQPDELVDPPLKDAIRSVRLSAEGRPDALTVFALIRTVGNAFRAVGRFFNDRLAKLKQKATDTFDETAGKALGKTLAYLLVGTPIGAALTTLYSLYPTEFAFVAQLIRAAKALF